MLMMAARCTLDSHSLKSHSVITSTKMYDWNLGVLFFFGGGDVPQLNLCIRGLQATFKLVKRLSVGIVLVEKLVSLARGGVGGGGKKIGYCS